MKLSDFNYEFPDELIAQRPLPERTASRMMIIDRKSGRWTHAQFEDIIGFLGPQDVVVLNDSKVIAARLFGKRDDGRQSQLLLTERTQGTDGSTEKWRCSVKRPRSYRAGEKIFFGTSATAIVDGHEADNLFVCFAPGQRQIAQENFGVPPLPPYIKRTSFKDYTEEDRQRYQTVYAKKPGSVAAPTAGLHFSNEIMDRIKKTGAALAHVTLHVGADTFAPVREEDVTKHKMHGETISIPKHSADTINAAKKEGRRIIAVGTTTVRGLESCFEEDRLISGTKRTNLFITPGYKFKVIDAMLTNFHQPGSTLLMLVSAFAGREFILSAYADAVKNRYRLFSYGDCMFIL